MYQSKILSWQIFSGGCQNDATLQKQNSTLFADARERLSLLLDTLCFTLQSYYLKF